MVPRIQADFNGTEGVARGREDGASIARKDASLLCAGAQYRTTAVVSVYRLISLIGPHCPESTYSSTYPFPGAHFVAARKKERTRAKTPRREKKKKQKKKKKKRKTSYKRARALRIISCEKKSKFETL